MNIEAGSFIWSAEKEIENIRKHGVSFALAALAFNDPARKLSVDKKHSRDEDRLFCVGKVGSRILTVRFTMRADRIRIIGAGYWREGRNRYHDKEEA